MINRLIYNNKVYYNKISIYKIKKTIKEQEINTTKLKGYGNSTWIEETDLCMLEIDGAITVMETKIKDRQETIESKVSMASLMNIFRRKNALYNEEMIKEIMEETENEMMNFNNDYVPHSSNNLEIGTLNKRLEEFGYEERAIGVEILYKDNEGKIKTETVSVVVDNNDNLLCSMELYEYTYRNDYSEDVYKFKEEDYEWEGNEAIVKHKGDWLKANLSEGKLEDSDGYIVYLNQGKTKNRADEEVINLIMSVLREGYVGSNVSDTIYVEINDKGEDLGMSDFAYIRMLKGEFKITNVFK